MIVANTDLKQPTDFEPELHLVQPAPNPFSAIPSTEYLELLEAQYRVLKHGHKHDRFKDNRNAKERAVESHQMIQLILARRESAIYSPHWQHISAPRHLGHLLSYFEQGIAPWKPYILAMFPQDTPLHARLHISPQGGHVTHPHIVAPLIAGIKGHCRLIESRPNYAVSYLDDAPIPDTAYFRGLHLWYRGWRLDERGHAQKPLTPRRQPHTAFCSPHHRSAIYQRLKA